MRERGAVPVGSMDALPEAEARMIRYLRQWFSGPDAKAMMWNDLATRLGPDRAREGLRQFEALLHLALDHGRRPLMRHGLECACVGADEAVFAQFIETARAGEREDAGLLAMLLLRSDIALVAVTLAEEVGHLLSGPFIPTEAPAKASSAQDRYLH
ncbi:hypothetical protein SAMN05421688_1996 [Poseidonocella pacifica]|uniref:Uncharacterized protein n=1 Tax=Poseidonocella pacifica TaxID=871651 RepID=A0A1I0XBN9_9RHOB|nr:hypothetical protein [Poseidonocella pacifica]SFA97333.1 hypothetical protein SAMN05421688_1996 [Poseidonocella pacifica]